MAKPIKRKREPSQEDIDSKMARYQNSVTFAITINPDDSFQTIRPGQRRFAEVRRHVIDFLVNHKSNIDSVDLYPDISYPPAMYGGKYPRIHYHGIIVFKDIIRYLETYDVHSHMSVEIDTIDNRKYWMKYCRKLIDRFPDYRMYCISESAYQKAVYASDCIGVDATKKNIVQLVKDFKMTLSDSDEED